MTCSLCPNTLPKSGNAAGTSNASPARGDTVPPSRSEVVAGVEGLCDNSKIGLILWQAHHLLGPLLPLTRRPGEELTQTGLHLRRRVEILSHCRVCRVQCRYELVVSAGCVDGRT